MYSTPESQDVTVAVIIMQGGVIAAGTSISIAISTAISTLNPATSTLTHVCMYAYVCNAGLSGVIV